MAGVASRALTGDASFPVRPFLSKVQKVRPALDTRGPGFVRSGKLGDDAAGRDRYLALVGGIALAMPKLQDCSVVAAESVGACAWPVHGMSIVERITYSRINRGLVQTVHTQETPRKRHRTTGMLSAANPRAGPSDGEFPNVPILSMPCSKITVTDEPARAMRGHNSTPA